MLKNSATSPSVDADHRLRVAFVARTSALILSYSAKSSGVSHDASKIGKSLSSLGFNVGFRYRSDVVRVMVFDLLWLFHRSLIVLVHCHDSLDRLQPHLAPLRFVEYQRPGNLRQCRQQLVRNLVAPADCRADYLQIAAYMFRIAQEFCHVFPNVFGPF